jgi:hypothetical protein
MKTMALRPVFDKTFVATPAWQDARREKYVEASSMVDDVFRSYRNHDPSIRREASRLRAGE